MPDIIEYFNLDKDSIRDMILARMESFLGDVPADGAIEDPETVTEAKAIEGEPMVLSPAA